MKQTATEQGVRQKTVHQCMQLVLASNIARWADWHDTEVRLSNGYIADIKFQWNRMDWIIEVKTILKSSIVENAISKYRTQCDFLLIAAPGSQYKDQEMATELKWISPIAEKIGYLEVNPSGIVLRHMPQRLTKETARRKG
jgi:hypothetical protein